MFPLKPMAVRPRLGRTASVQKAYPCAEII